MSRRGKGQTLPESWALTTLGEVCQKPQYGYTSKASSKGKTKLLRTTDITAGAIRWEDVPYCSSEPEKLEKYLLKSNDIVVSRAGSVGFSHLIKNPPRAVFASYLIRFLPHIDPEYVRYYLTSPLYWNAISEHKMGIAVPNVNATKLSRIEIPVAPHNEQHRIVTKIEELFSELDQGMNSLKTARAQLKTYRQSLLKAAFGGRLTPDSKAAAWKRYTFGDLLEFVTSGSRGWAKYYSQEGDLFIRAQNLKHDYLNLEEKAYVKLPGRTEGTRTQVKEGDLLITITGANVTKAALVKPGLGKAYVSQHVALCRLKEIITPEFAYWFMVSDTNGRAQLNKMAYGAGKPGLNLTNIREVTIALPPVDAQKEIVRIIESKLDKIDYLNSLIKENLRRIEALRQSILKSAFEGKLVPQDPNDEPASELLERICQEQDEKPAPVRRKRRKQKATADLFDGNG